VEIDAPAPDQGQDCGVWSRETKSMTMQFGLQIKAKMELTSIKTTESLLLLSVHELCNRQKSSFCRPHNVVLVLKFRAKTFA